MKCCICKEELMIEARSGWGEGNNAQPVMNGRCCDECNMSVVVPRRFQEAREWEVKC